VPLAYPKRDMRSAHGPVGPDSDDPNPSGPASGSPAGPTCPPYGPARSVRMSGPEASRPRKGARERFPGSRPDPRLSEGDDLDISPPKKSVTPSPEPSETAIDADFPGDASPEDKRHQVSSVTQHPG
jgi:hypothetical protein